MATEDPIPVSTIRKITVLGGAVGALASIFLETADPPFAR